jgi:ABC-2 type transport system ATP-binding protein
MNNHTIIEFRNVGKKFGAFRAVEKVSFEIRQGEILGFLGPNGAGKSTTMKMLANLLTPTDGEIFIKHQDQLVKLTTTNYDTLLDNIGFLIETPAFYDHMTPRQHLTYFAKLKGYDRAKIAQRVENIVKQIGMFEWIDQPLKTFSKGMRQKIGILASIVHDPAVVVLDEPTSGLDPQASREVRDYILSLKTQGKTIFISSHLLFEISEIADRIAVIMHGKLLACDTISNLKAQAGFSTIRMELLDPFTPVAATTMMNQLIPKLKGICGLTEEIIKTTPIMRYIPDGQYFEIAYDGKRETQHGILQFLIREGVQIVDFSTPKASLLENLYLRLIHQAEKSEQQITKASVQLKGVL